MKFKVSVFGYYSLLVICIAVFIGWLVLIFCNPIHSKSDFLTSICYLLFFEFLFLLCSPILQRRVIVNDTCIAEKWLCFVIKRIVLDEIVSVGLCNSCIAAHARQYVFISDKPMSAEQAYKLFNSRKGRNIGFIAIDHPQKGLDECISQLVEKYNLNYSETVL